MDDFVKSHYSPNCTMVLLAGVRRVTSIESSTIVNCNAGLQEEHK